MLLLCFEFLCSIIRFSSLVNIMILYFSSLSFFVLHYIKILLLCYKICRKLNLIKMLGCDWLLELLASYEEKESITNQSKNENQTSLKSHYHVKIL